MERSHHNAGIYALVAVLGFLVAVLTWELATTRPPQTAISITACQPADYDATEGCLTTGNRLDGPVELSEDLRIPVAGDVLKHVEGPATYRVTVSWVSIESGAEFPILGPVDLTWEDDRMPYSIEWSPPNQLLAFAAEPEPDGDLGRWRITGRGEPVDPSHSPFAWDSVETFQLVVAE